LNEILAPVNSKLNGEKPVAMESSNCASTGAKDFKVGDGLDSRAKISFKIKSAGQGCPARRWKDFRADGDTAPLILKNLPPLCRRRRQKISRSDAYLDARAINSFKKNAGPCKTSRSI
jgi:hypothetical protein